MLRERRQDQWKSDESGVAGVAKDEAALEHAAALAGQMQRMQEDRDALCKAYPGLSHSSQSAQFME